MSAPQSLEAQMQAIVALHDLTTISFTARSGYDAKQISPFSCDIHHETVGDRIHGVTFGYGDTLEAAYESAVAALEAERAATVVRWGA